MPTVRLGAVAATVASAVAAFAAGCAVAQQPQQPPGGYTYIYGSLGYVDQNVGTADLGTIRGQVGGRINQWFGLEGELAAGVNREGIGPNSLVVNGVRSPLPKQTVKINNQEAVYAVGYLPLTPSLDLFGRVGAGRTAWSFSGSAPWGTPDGSWNLGAGGQYFLDRNGVRIEYLREQFSHAPATNNWAISYVRKF